MWKRNFVLDIRREAMLKKSKYLVEDIVKIQNMLYRQCTVRCSKPTAYEEECAYCPICIERLAMKGLKFRLMYESESLGDATNGITEERKKAMEETFRKGYAMHFVEPREELSKLVKVVQEKIDNGEIKINIPICCFIFIEL
jgi:hypothetical protein